MKQLLNDWQIKGQQKKQFHGALKALKNQQNEKKSKLSTDTAIMQAIQQQNKTKTHYKNSKEIDKYNHSQTKLTKSGGDRKSNQNDINNHKDDNKKTNILKMKQNIKIINGSKVIQQIDHLMDIEHFEDAICLTEKALKIMDQQFGHNFIEKTHNFIPSPMYYQSHHLDKNQNIDSLSSLNKKLNSSLNDNSDKKTQSDTNTTKTTTDTTNDDNINAPPSINVNYNININFNINVNNHSRFLPTHPSIQHATFGNFNNILNQFKLNTNNLSPLLDTANNTKSQKSSSPTNSIRQLPTSPPPLTSNYNQNSLSALFDRDNNNQTRGRATNKTNKQRRTASASPSNKDKKTSKTNQSESAPPPKHNENCEEKTMTVKSGTTTTNQDINMNNIPLIPQMMVRSTADPDNNEKKQQSPVKSTDNNINKQDDVVRLQHRGFMIDLSPKNAELVPLG